MEVVLKMLFLSFNNANIQFADKKLIWKIYTTKKTLPTAQQVVLINKKKFARIALDENPKVFIIYMALLTLNITIQPTIKTQIAFFIAKKVNFIVKYPEYANVFLNNYLKYYLNLQVLVNIQPNCKMVVNHLLDSFTA